MFFSALRLLSWPFRLLLRHYTFAVALLLLGLIAAPFIAHLWAYHEYHEAEKALDNDLPLEARGIFRFA